MSYGQGHLGSLEGFTGTLNTLAQTKDLSSAGAACILAGVAIGSASLVGALNIKAGNKPGHYLGLPGVCNQLAGTTNRDALSALWKLAGITT